MPSITPKENYLRLTRGECPEWVPFSSFVPGLTDMAPQSAMIFPSWLNKDRTKEGGFDIFGVEYEANYETNFGALPKPGKFLLQDIRKWRDVIKTPDISDIDWELMAKRDIEAAKVDRTQTSLAVATHNGYFQNLMAFMGFTEGLCAMYEEPEEVKELMSYMCDFFSDFGRRAMIAYDADIIDLGDDMATKTEPFVSVEMYRELVKPSHARHAKVAGLDIGKAATMHNCGHCESYLQDYVDFGISMWNPAQTSNDLVAIKKKFGNKLAIAGGWEYVMPLDPSKIDEEYIVESVKKVINELAPGGGYAFMGGVMGLPGDENAARINKLVGETAAPLCLNFYK